jgi:hypothetical protein
LVNTSQAAKPIPEIGVHGNGGDAMSQDDVEYLLSGGESPQDLFAREQYRLDIMRGKSLLQLQAVADSITPQIRQSWAPGSFTPIQTPVGRFDEIVCNLSYHFHKHGQKYGTIQSMTDEALRYFHGHRNEATIRETDGLLVFPNGSLFEQNGRIVTFVG